MTGAQLDELMAVAMRMQSDSEKMGERSVSMFAYAVQVAVLEILENRCKYEELQSQNADMAVQLANTESKCRELAAENAALKDAIGKHADSYIMCGYCRTERDGKNDDVCEVLDSTPATDDFLAEVRAQGVDELAELYLTLAHHEANRSIAENWRESARFAKDYAAQLRKGGAA